MQYSGMSEKKFLVENINYNDVNIFYGKLFWGHPVTMHIYDVYSDIPLYLHEAELV